MVKWNIYTGIRGRLESKKNAGQSKWGAVDWQKSKGVQYSPKKSLVMNPNSTQIKIRSNFHGDRVKNLH